MDTDAYIGEIRLFAGNYPPLGWAFCDGRSIAVNNAPFLFDLIGTTYGGGNGYFNLPDLRGRIPIHHGHGDNLSPRSLGDKGGEETVTLTTDHLPKHTHDAQ